MNYHKQNFRPGQKLYASQLNSMDDTILELVDELQKIGSLSIGSVQTGESASATITRSETGALQLNLVLPVTSASGETGDGITDAAKSYILTLFENAAYTNSTMLRTCKALADLWKGKV